ADAQVRASASAETTATALALAHATAEAAASAATSASASVRVVPDIGASVKAFIDPECLELICEEPPPVTVTPPAIECPDPICISWDFGEVCTGMTFERVATFPPKVAIEALGVVSARLLESNLPKEMAFDLLLDQGKGRLKGKAPQQSGEYALKFALFDARGCKLTNLSITVAVEACHLPVPKPDPCASFTIWIKTDKYSYTVGETVAISFYVSECAQVRIIDHTPDGKSVKLWSESVSAGTHRVTGTVTEPVGTETVELIATSSSGCVASAYTSFEVTKPPQVEFKFHFGIPVTPKPPCEDSY
ncbi:hypothetical protein KAX17_12530, partial [Candidatus Bipolaricaulota bacterium]|nr:hypothetical protein [Candidatus Bipolaricaulota bacterium]